jgi:hypothetical protein
MEVIVELKRHPRRKTGLLSRRRKDVETQRGRDPLAWVI